MKFYEYTVDVVNTKDNESTMLYNLNSFIASYEQIHTHTKININEYINNLDTKRLFLMNNITIKNQDNICVPKILFYHFIMWVDPNICINMLKILSSNPITRSYCSDKDIEQYQTKTKKLHKKCKKYKTDIVSIVQCVEKLNKQKEGVKQELDTLQENLHKPKKN